MVLRDMVLDVLHLLGPAAIVSVEGVEAAVCGKFVEARLGEHEQRATGGLLQPELDECGWFLRAVEWVVRFLNRLGMRPCEGEQLLRLHFLDDSLPLEMLIAGISDLAAGDLTRHKGTVQLYAEPLAELTIIGKGAPNPRNRRFEFDPFLDAVGHNMQPLGCIIARARENCNL